MRACRWPQDHTQGREHRTLSALKEHVHVRMCACAYVCRCTVIRPPICLSVRLFLLVCYSPSQVRAYLRACTHARRKAVGAAR